MAKDKGEQPDATPGKFGQIRAAYQITKRSDRFIGLILLGIFLAVFALLLGLGFLIGHPFILGFFGFMAATLATTMVFARRAERAAFSQLDGQTGAAYAALGTLRKGWVVTPGVAASREQAVVHRAVGRPGVVLVGEGPRVGVLLAAEKKKYARIVPDVPLFEFQAGDGAGQTPLRKLPRELMKLPRTLPASQVSDVEKRLKAIGSLNLSMPKGPMPKGARMPRMPRGR